MPDVHPSTLRAHRALADALPFADAQDFEDARRGFVHDLLEYVGCPDDAVAAAMRALGPQAEDNPAFRRAG